MISETIDYQDLDRSHYLQTFRRFPVTLQSGSGSRVRDTEGKEYIDLLAGIAVNSLGHCHPAVVEAIRRQAGELMHISNIFLSKPQALLSKRLAELSGLNRVFFANSGAESVEGALKLARKYAHSKGRGGTVISMENAFHGRTLATIAMGKAAMQKGFAPIPSGFKQVPFGNLEAVEAAIDQDVAAVIVEPVQGEGGIHVAPADYLRGLRELCDRNDLVLIFDEIQTGVGRTGRWFAKEHSGVQPDAMTLAKGLGGGVPIGAFLANERVASAIEFGDHGTTFGGNPLVCAASLAVLETVEKDGLLEAAEASGEWIRGRIAAMNRPSIRGIRGLGLMIGVEFDREAKPLVGELLKRGVIANATAGNVLRLVPPLNIPREDLEQAMDILEATLKEVHDG